MTFFTEKHTGLGDRMVTEAEWCDCVGGSVVCVAMVVDACGLAVEDLHISTLSLTHTVVKQLRF
jgi:hypothetical protein